MCYVKYNRCIFVIVFFFMTGALLGVLMSLDSFQLTTCIVSVLDKVANGYFWT